MAAGGPATSLWRLVEARAAREPETPWLFERQGQDWRWLAYGTAVREGGVASGIGAPGTLAAQVLAFAAGGELDPLAAGARTVAAALAVGAERDVTLLAAPLDDPLARLQLAWSLVAGAAIALEGVPEQRVPSTLWVRPTVLAGRAADVALLATEPGLLRDLARGRRRRLSPFGRLRAWLVPAGERVSTEVREAWQSLGVRLLPVDLPALLPQSGKLPECVV